MFTAYDCAKLIYYVESPRCIRKVLCLPLVYVRCLTLSRFSKIRNIYFIWLDTDFIFAWLVCVPAQSTVHRVFASSRLVCCYYTVLNKSAKNLTFGPSSNIIRKYNFRYILSGVPTSLTLFNMRVANLRSS